MCKKCGHSKSNKVRGGGGGESVGDTLCLEESGRENVEIKVLLLPPTLVPPVPHCQGRHPIKVDTHPLFLLRPCYLCYSHDFISNVDIDELLRRDFVCPRLSKDLIQSAADGESKSMVMFV